MPQFQQIVRRKLPPFRSRVFSSDMLELRPKRVPVSGGGGFCKRHVLSPPGKQWTEFARLTSGPLG